MIQKEKLYQMGWFNYSMALYQKFCFYVYLVCIGTSKLETLQLTALGWHYKPGEHHGVNRARWIEIYLLIAKMISAPLENYWPKVL